MKGGRGEKRKVSVIPTLSEEKGKREVHHLK